jgi:hypothetical protein
MDALRPTVFDFYFFLLFTWPSRESPTERRDSELDFPLSPMSLPEMIIAGAKIEVLLCEEELATK